MIGRSAANYYAWGELMNVHDRMGETRIEHLGRRLAAEVGDPTEQIDVRVRDFDPNQREAMIRCLELIAAAWPECPVSQIEAIETLHLRARLEFVRATEIAR